MMKTIIWVVAVMLQLPLMPVSATEYVVEIINFKFSPTELTIHPGDTVTWVNRDVVPHNVATGSTNLWRSPNLLRGEMFSIVLSAELSYVCSLHAAVMKGAILMAKE